jgi:hypothetical protein
MLGSGGLEPGPAGRDYVIAVGLETGVNQQIRGLNRSGEQQQRSDDCRQGQPESPIWVSIK